MHLHHVMRRTAVEPIHHAASPRNRRKAPHHARNLEEELAYLIARNGEDRVNLEYALGRIRRLCNRLEAECANDRQSRNRSKQT